MVSAYAISSFACGVTLLVVGIVHVCDHVLGKRWCETSCVGPYLFWDKDNFFDDTNSRYRLTFSLMPKPLGENFAVLGLAVATIRAHFEGAHPSLTSYKSNSLWLLFVGLFASFPFAGGLGIMLGFLCSATAALGVFHHLNGRSGPATLSLRVADGGIFKSAVGCCTTPEWLNKLWNILVTTSLALVVLNNFIHVVRNEFHDWCNDDGNDSCVGPWLIWPDDFFDSINANKFGSVFSLDLNRGLELWTPVLLVLCFVASTPLSWFKASGFLVILACFGAFGYTGNMGILIGMLLFAMALFATVIGFFSDRETTNVPSGYHLLA